MKMFKYLLMALMAINLCGCGKPRNVEVAIDAPLEVDMGEEFTIVARVRNTASRTQTLVDLDIDNSYLQGIAIIKTEPDYTSSMRVPIVNQTSYTFDLPVQPGEEVRILLHAQAVQTGDYGGDVDFCINSSTRFIGRQVRTIVR